ncbi:MAG: hypothetical protein DI551_03820 [Micavibrio aeruginosavorus]|uniref:Probable membrane transporter protein n=1 Tax=Micavibrio aeruginosavorus TaxID=349221 RepID=A0A2W5N8V8_9BACT|nr:MAG: hypothetical protein DI551_03820 [Micavibrio aeruginosavorus]
MPEISSELLTFMAIGFFAQLVDGALGMAFGVISSTILLSVGQAPAVVSASVHTAEMFVTAFSAGSHIYFKNVNWKLCLPLAALGALGGIFGATLLANVDGDAIKPFISVYLFLLGLFILWKATLKAKETPPSLLPVTHVSALGLIGGAMDACGGGGWGPIVTSNLIARGDNPRMVIGSVNTSEFIVTTAITLAFVTTLGFHFSEVVIGLLLGGIVAAPLGAIVLRKVSAKTVMYMVGTLITGLSLWQIVKLLSV